VVHRDLKPGNVLVQLVDGKAIGKIIDFGIAVGEQNTAAAPAGTPEYMAPEQLRRAHVLDARTDVHALGVTLIELLCICDGAGALASGWSSQTLRDALSVANQAHASSAAQVNLQRIPAPLRAIARKAMEVDPNARYASADAMAADLRAYVQHRPVAAMAFSRRYHLGLFVRRNRLAVFFGSALSVALVAGLAAALYGLNQARQEREIARAQAARAERTAAFLGDVLSSVDPDQARAMDTKLLKSILQRAGENISALKQNPQMRAEINGIIARTYISISEYKLAQQYAAEALHALKALRASGKPDARAELETRDTIADAISGQGQQNQSLAAREPMCADALQALGALDLDTLRCQTDLAWDLFDAGKIKESATLAERTKQALIRTGAPEKHILATLRVLGAALGESGQLALAESTQRELVRRSTALLGPENTHTISARNSLAVALLQQQRYDEAARELETLVPLSERIYGSTHLGTIGTYANYAGALRQSGKLAQSGPYYAKALALAQASANPDSGYVMMLQVNMANFELDSGQLSQAMQRLQQVQTSGLRSLDAAHPLQSEWLRTRAKIYAAQKQNAAARADWQSVLLWCQKHDPSSIPEAQKAIAALAGP
jgi:eukaryotic-like serine/threonine-protein kinase